MSPSYRRSEESVSPPITTVTDEVVIVDVPGAGDPQAWKEDAGFGLRFGAFMFDLLLTLLVILFGLFALVEIGGRELVGSSLSVALGLFSMTYLINGWILPGWTGQTVGKQILGLQIVRTTAEPFSYGTAFLRHVVGYPLCAIPLMVGFIWILWDPRQQGWHDKISKTRVVKLV